MSQDELYLDVELQRTRFCLSVSDIFPLEGITAVFGASGSGKTTLLRLIAGFEMPTSGTLTFRGQKWVDAFANHFLHPSLRPVRLVMQGGQLLPHKTVLQNLIFADKRSRLVSGDRFENVMDALDIEPLSDRKPDTLSGGQRQRVALAQALLARPALLLLDEPLSALDLLSRRRILNYLEHVSQTYHMPMLYVSHDMAEVLRIADRVLYLQDGKQVDFGPSVDVLNKHGFRAHDSERTGLILSGEIGPINETYQLVEVQVGKDKLLLPHDGVQVRDGKVRIIVRASDIALSTKPPSGLSIRNALSGTIKAIRTMPDQPMADIELDIGQADLPIRVTRAAISDLDLSVGQPAFALVKTAQLAR